MQSPGLRVARGGTNGHMISINQTLGYYVLGRAVRSWELPATRVEGVKGVKGVKGAAQS
jgi:hypothetical protein